MSSIKISLILVLMCFSSNFIQVFGDWLLSEKYIRINDFKTRLCIHRSKEFRRCFDEYDRKVGKNILGDITDKSNFKSKSKLLCCGFWKLIEV